MSSNVLEKNRYWVVIPAAGVGKRMLVDHPKQYLQLANKTVMEYSISQFTENPLISAIVVAVSEGDEYWAKIPVKSRVPLYVTHGGMERCHSVLNGLKFLRGKANAADWVLVHDAARPCLRVEDVNKLIKQVGQHAVGGLLGLPVADTLKLCGDNQRVKRTVSRVGLWRALTPQMFRYEKLLNALELAIAMPEKVTDEASAIEMAGYEPIMVEGRWDNIKITHPQDLAQAELIMQNFKEIKCV